MRKKEGNLEEARVKFTYGKIALDKVYREYNKQATKNVQKEALKNGALEEEMAAIATKERRAANRRAASSGANRGHAGGSNKKPLKKVVKKLRLCCSPRTPLWGISSLSMSHDDDVCS